MLFRRTRQASLYRAALAAVESGNVDAGFVYATDAKISSKLRIG